VGMLYVSDRCRPSLQGKIKAAVVRLGIKGNEGKIRRLEIAHDNWCAIWDGKDCTCEPEIELRE